MGDGCTCFKNPQGEVVALRATCPSHGDYQPGTMPTEIEEIDPDPLPGADDLRRALAEFETRPPVMVDDDNPIFEPRPEGTTTFRFTLEVDSFGFLGESRTLTNVAQTVAQALHRSMGPTFTPAGKERVGAGTIDVPAAEGMWRLWSADGRRVMFDAQAADGEHEGHDPENAVLFVMEPH